MSIRSFRSKKVQGEDDDLGWDRLAPLSADTQVLGGDRYVTTDYHVEVGIARAEANSSLVMPNPAGTLGQALRLEEQEHNLPLCGSSRPRA